MKGAITEPCENIIKAPISTIVKIKGARKYFFLTLRKSQISLSNSNKANILEDFL
tara:strand:- start:593 stop:757 length:165 start_codon:yes stop_codon:yes gene_type:complete